MIESLIIENDFKLRMFLRNGKTLKLTPVTEEGHLGLLLVIDIDYDAAHAQPPFTGLSGLYFKESDEVGNKLDIGHV